jgi:hypothetical protein
LGRQDNVCLPAQVGFGLAAKRRYARVVQCLRRSMKGSLQSTWQISSSRKAMANRTCAYPAKHQKTRLIAAVAAPRSRNVPSRIRPRPLKTTRARLTTLGERSGRWAAAPWVEIILITPMSIPKLRGTVPRSACLHPTSFSWCRPRWFPYRTHIVYMKVG